MGRQMYHRSVLTLLLLLALLITGCSSLLNNPDSSNADLLSSPDFIQTKGEIDDIVSQIKHKHSISVFYKKGPLFSWLKFKYKLAAKSDYAKLLKYLAVLQKELDKYPEDFLQEAGVKRIVVCKDLSSLGFSAAGFPKLDAKNQLGISPDQKVLLFFGIVHPYKGLETLIHALALLHPRGINPTLIVAGEFWQDKSSLLNPIEKAKIKVQILFVIIIV